jgi:3-isopropylmalate/(R)-2-methylmalate dehydratase small subunit
METQRITQIIGTALPLRGDDMDTDRIMPARYLKTITFNDLERHVFEDDRAADARAGVVHPFDDPRYENATVLVVNSNFGCGSSREHAPQALRKWGIDAIVGESFSDIFFGNAVMIGLACVTASREDVHALMTRIEQQPQTRLAVDVASGACRADGMEFQVALPRHVRDAFVTGAWDSTGLLRERYTEVDAVAARLPYITGFASPLSGPRQH